MPGIGMTLRSARIQRGLSIEQVAQDTRISARFLEALEDEAFDELPAPVYVRGFLRSYSNYLRLDPQPLLAQLPGTQGGGDALAAAPTVRDAIQDPPKRGPDPFRPSPPSRPPMVIGEDPPLRAATLRRADPFTGRRAEPEAPLNGGRYEPDYRPGRVGGVLMERGAVYEDNGRIVRFAAIIGGAFVVVALMALATMVLGGDGGGRQNTLPTDGGNTPGASGTSNPIVVGSATTNPSATPSESATPDGGDTPTPTEATPTATEDVEEQPTATPTSVPPTATPTVAIPTSTPTIGPPGHGSFFSECPSDGGQPLCDPPMTVVCLPEGGWFVDYGDDFPAADYGYYWKVAVDNGDAIRIGDSGCV